MISISTHSSVVISNESCEIHEPTGSREATVSTAVIVDVLLTDFNQ